MSILDQETSLDCFKMGFNQQREQIQSSETFCPTSLAWITYNRWSKPFSFVNHIPVFKHRAFLSNKSDEYSQI